MATVTAALTAQGIKQPLPLQQQIVVRDHSFTILGTVKNNFLKRRKVLKKKDGKMCSKRDKIPRGLNRTAVLILHRANDSARAESCITMK